MLEGCVRLSKGGRLRYREAKHTREFALLTIVSVSYEEGRERGDVPRRRE
jgi:hypothetical protein